VRLRVNLAGLGALILALAVPRPGFPQTPSGAIAGFVTDPTGAAAAAIAITVVDLKTTSASTTLTDLEGYFRVEALTPGSYRVIVEATGFNRVEQPAVVEVGTTTTVEVTLAVGQVTETVVVEGVSPMLRRDQHQVAGIVGRDQIENLPLNGRHFLELAKLEPGVTSPVRGTNNRTFISVLGGIDAHHRRRRQRQRPRRDRHEPADLAGGGAGIPIVDGGLRCRDRDDDERRRQHRHTVGRREGCRQRVLSLSR
jgi:hypothetical protein